MQFTEDIRRESFTRGVSAKQYTHGYPNARFRKVKNLQDANYFVKFGKEKPQRKITMFFRSKDGVL